ncbi:MAG: hypothetical protein AAB452_02305 [Patescibacteria group bacterium]
MAEEPQQLPPSPEPIPSDPPSVETFTPVEDPSSASMFSGAKRKAILGTTLVVLIMGGLVWYDPFQIFNFNVELSKDKAAESTPTSSPIVPRGISAICQAGIKPLVRVSWEAVAGATVNGIERSADAGAFEPIFFEGGDPPFNVFSFDDTSVIMGSTYRYRVFGGELGANRIATAVVSGEACR